MLRERHRGKQEEQLSHYLRMVPQGRGTLIIAMAITVGVVCESAPGERRVAMVPSAMSVLNKSGVEFLMEFGAGTRAGFPDGEYLDKSVRLALRETIFNEADVLLQVRSPGANPEAGGSDLRNMRREQIVIGFGEPLTAFDEARELADRGVSFLAMELMRRITRAQSMDALSSMATIAGYKAVLIAADSLPRMFPMLMTAAGTIAPDVVPAHDCAQPSRCRDRL